MKEVSTSVMWRVVGLAGCVRRMSVTLSYSVTALAVAILVVGPIKVIVRSKEGTNVSVY
jgi:hypothetical protein